MIPVSDIAFTGHNLQRPECVLAHASGTLFASDWEGRGGVSMTTPDGQSFKLLVADPSVALRPNGIALEASGSFLLTHLGDTEGGVYRLYPDGSVECVISTVDGEPLPPTNFVQIDSLGRLWVTVSTTLQPRAKDYRPDACTGFIVLHDPEPNRTRIVANGLGYTNECVFSADGQQLYVNETFARRLACYDVNADGNLDNYRVISRFESGCFPDGMAVDSTGDLLVASIVSNRLIRVNPHTGTHTIIIEDVEPPHLEKAELAWQSGRMEREHLDRIVSQRLRNISNIAFGGPGLDQAFLGCLLGSQIATLKMSTSGLAPVHWNTDITDLLNSSAWTPASDTTSAIAP